MFGSDWPVCTSAASFKQWVEALSILTQDAGDENQRKLFYAENAEGLSTGLRLGMAANEHQYSRMMANRVVVQIEKEILWFIRG